MFGKRIRIGVFGKRIRSKTGIILRMADGFDEVHRQLEATVSELRTATDPNRRRMLLHEMGRLLAETERISSQPPKVNPESGK